MTIHLMTASMGYLCGEPALTGAPGTAGRASSSRAEVTCAHCLRADGDRARALVRDMLATMGPSRQALGFAIRAGQCGVRDEEGRVLAAACMDDDDGILADAAQMDADCAEWADGAVPGRGAAESGL